MSRITQLLRGRTLLSFADGEVPVGECAWEVDAPGGSASTVVATRTVSALAELKPGSRGTVVALTHRDDDGSRALARRLADLGFTPGTAVEVLRRAPLGDPVVYRVRNYDICLRDRQARSISVEVAPT